jgi:hypothetical protein
MSKKSLCKLAWQATQVVGKLRRGSKLTKDDQLQCLIAIGTALAKTGLNSIFHLKPWNIENYFAGLRGRGLSPGRMANHATAMRLICRAIGKPEIVPSNSKLGCARDLANRTKHADERMDNAKVAEVRTKLSEPNRIAYDMARHFGLRQKESLLSHRLVERDGATWLQVEGAKGGRPRQVPVETVEQREILERNHAYRASHGGKLIDEHKSLLQGIRELQNQLAAAGATRSSGANMHTLRREWIIERCELIAAAPESARSEMLKDLVESVGHGRVEVIRCYTSILKVMK